MRFLVGFLACASVAAAHLVGHHSLQHYNGYQVIRVGVSSDKHFEALVTLYNSEHNFDFWNGPTRSGTSDIMARPAQVQFLKDYLTQHGLQYSVMIDDVERVVSQERAGRMIRGVMDKTPKAVDWTEYHSYATIISWLEDTAAAHSDIASTQVIGQTTEGRDLVLLTISTGGSGKPAIFIDGAMHSREWISPAVTTYVINELLNNRDQYADILDSVDFYILPVLNADGYEYTQSTDRMWRKTRSDHNAPDCMGVDPNRNYDYHFGELGASSNPCSETYHGPRAFSEPETDAIRRFIEANNEVNWTIYISMHSYSQLWLTPWNWTTDFPTDHDDIMALANEAVAAIKAVHGKTYTAGSGANVLYYSSGCSVDWAKGAGFKYSFTIELRDEGYYGFLLPPSEIIPTSEEIWASLQAISRRIAAK